MKKQSKRKRRTKLEAAQKGHSDAQRAIWVAHLRLSNAISKLSWATQRLHRTWRPQGPLDEDAAEG